MKTNSFRTAISVANMKAPDSGEVIPVRKERYFWGRKWVQFEISTTGPISFVRESNRAFSEKGFDPSRKKPGVRNEPRLEGNSLEKGTILALPFIFRDRKRALKPSFLRFLASEGWKSVRLGQNRNLRSRETLIFGIFTVLGLKMGFLTIF